MSLMAIFWVIASFLLIAIIVLITLAVWDWRAWMVRKVGHDYRRGLAHVKRGDTWVYRESWLYYAGNDAMSYARYVTHGKVKTCVFDIVPNKIGFAYDEYTGARVYRMQPGGVIASSDDGNAPSVDYPEKLISAHVLDRTSVDLALSVTTGETGTNWKMIVGLAVILVVVGIAGFAIFQSMRPVPALPADNVTNPVPVQITTPAENGTSHHEIRPPEGS